ncbi:hypothetical protein HanPI659440_Chr13g0523601 [Helianthus annuus]|nr:hypothetical protein HanPI659440_Chr13g0523601 [Helianthus annuus]
MHMTEESHVFRQVASRRVASTNRVSTYILCTAERKGVGRPLPPYRSCAQE